MFTTVDYGKVNVNANVIRACHLHTNGYRGEVSDINGNIIVTVAW